MQVEILKFARSATAETLVGIALQLAAEDPIRFMALADLPLGVFAGIEVSASELIAVRSASDSYVGRIKALRDLKGCGLIEARDAIIALENYL